MSRIGKKPITVPSGVSVSTQNRKVEVSGPKGNLSLMLSGNVRLAQTEGSLSIEQERKSAQASADHGLYRQLLANMVEGVSRGFERRLEVIGVGYRVTVQGSNLVFSLGYSHPIEVKAPAGITFAAQKNTVIVSGLDKAQVGQVAANIRRLRPPEPYKGKGIRYEGEQVRRKAGKAGKAAK